MAILYYPHNDCDLVLTDLYADIQLLMVGDTDAEKPTSGLRVGWRYFAKDNGKFYKATGVATWVELAAGGGGAAWGAITGLIADQTDLVAALAATQAAAEATAAAALAAKKLDELGTPTDVTTLNADTAKHGLMQKYPGGTTNFLRADGAFAAPGGGASATTVETNLGSTPVFTGKFTITDAAIGPTSKVLCWQAPGPYTGKGTRADEAEMQPVSVIAVEPATGSAVVKWQTPPAYAPVIYGLSGGDGGRPNIVASPAGRRSEHDVVGVRRTGKVSGNVKFSYMVLA